MTRRVLWLPEESFAESLYQLLLDVGIINPEPPEELHALVTPAWLSSYAVRNTLDPQVPAQAIDIIKAIKHNHEEWSRVVMRIFCEPLLELREKIAQEVEKKPQEFFPHITLSRTRQEISEDQQEEIHKHFANKPFHFVKEVRATPGRTSKTKGFVFPPGMENNFL